jgi:hypothetical protein
MSPLLTQSGHGDRPRSLGLPFAGRRCQLRPLIDYLPFLEIQNLLGVQHDVCRVALEAALGLMHQDAHIWQSKTLALLPGGEKRAPCCRACPENAHGDRLAIGHIVCSFAIIEKKTMKPVPVDLDKDTRIAKREASSRIANFPPS